MCAGTPVITVIGIFLKNLKRLHFLKEAQVCSLPEENWPAEMLLNSSEGLAC